MDGEVHGRKDPWTDRSMDGKSSILLPLTASKLRSKLMFLITKKPLRPNVN